jgi:hypothetical protein
MAGILDDIVTTPQPKGVYPMAGILDDLANFFTGGVSGAASAVLGPVVARLVDLIPDKAAAAAAAQAAADKAAMLDAQMEASQSAIDAKEVASESAFVSGWRPFVGWVCGAGLAWNCMVAPLVSYVARFAGVTAALPAFDTSTLTSLLVPMLGLGAYRTVEKVAGVAGPMMTKITAAKTAVMGGKP